MEQILAKTMEQEVSKAAVQEKQLLLSRLLARLAHEIRNPLSSLDIHVQLLEEDVARAAPAIREGLAGRFAVIRGELERLDSLVKQFLSLAGRSSTNPQPVDVAKVANHVGALLKPDATARGIEIAVQLAEPLPLLQADPVQFTQALLNLVLNAIQAVGRNGRVGIAAALDETQTQMRVTVRDSGPGIPDDRQALIFEPFYTTKEDGSGLGLWIVQQIVLAHGGTVAVANAPGGGAEFALQLPLRAAEALRE